MAAGALGSSRRAEWEGGGRRRAGRSRARRLDADSESEATKRSPTEKDKAEECEITFGRQQGVSSQRYRLAQLVSDDGRDWKWRPPPRGFTAESYMLCESFELSRICRYGAQCVEAHGIEELTEWKERFEYRKMKMQRACEKELYGKSYTEQLLDKWVQATSPEKVLREKLDGVEDACSADLITTVSSKISNREWLFTLKTKRPLKAVALLQDAHRNHFMLKQIFPGEHRSRKGKDIQKTGQVELQSDQEWVMTGIEKSSDLEHGPILEHRISVVFSTDIYGTFRQSVVFDLGTEPVLVKHLCVDVVPVTDVDKIKEIKKDIILSTSTRWDSDNADITAFTSPVYPGLATPYGREACERDRDLLSAYPQPKASTLCLTQSTVIERNVTKNNYRTRMHELLSVEELARYEQVARFNVTCGLCVAPSYLLSPSGSAASTAKYAHSGELFALLQLGKDLSEDTSAGRLILNNCTTVLISTAAPALTGAKRRVYEALIEDKGKNMIYLRLSSTCVRELNLKSNMEFAADIQFQLNRLTYCEWHYAIDRISDYKLIFPDVTIEPMIPQFCAAHKTDQSLDVRLNVKQREAVYAITAAKELEVPPILLIGPFGTGKTFTLAQAIKQILLQPEAKILICTHSNSAADLYIKDYLHPWLENGVTDARPLRIYYHKRWVSTVDEVVQQYCLIDLNGGRRSFQLPTLEDVSKHRIVVVTLSISMYLSTLGLPKGHFTHILLDEAAQAMESEALMPLAIAVPTTRIVLAGDHMQLSPEIFSQFAKERNLHISLLERLYDHYPANFPYKILLCENYRAHEAIISFTSELFYEQKLIASGKQPKHDKFFPLTFFTTRGEDVQDQNSTAFYNNSEVYEIVERVYEMRCNWPAQWGKFDEHSIGILTPYADQVFRIRTELRKRRMGGISVERVLNVQGKQFRAVFLSTVRTRRTCQAAAELDYGFLSNRKLLNTAITRAQSLVAVIGDPVALCSIGRCRKVWERFISICHDNNSLFGITWQLLRAQLDGVEFKKTFTLNPLAPEFIPRAMQAESYIKFHVPDVVMPSMIPTAPGLNIPMPISQIGVKNLIRTPAPPIPPLINPANAQIIPYPLFYYPGAATQPGAGIFSLNRAPQSVPITSLPSHRLSPGITQWNVNSFPIPTPSDPAGTAAWSFKQLPKKPVEINQPMPTPLHNLHNIVPSHFMNASPHLITSQILAAKNQQFLQMQQQPPRRISPENSPIATSIMNDNIVNNDLMSSPFLRNTPLIGADRIPYQNSINNITNVKYQDSHSPNSVLKDKDQIQFLQNVHFPERPAVTQNITPIQSNFQPNSMQEMLNENQEAQLRWYHHLLDTQGSENASKFLDLIAQRRAFNAQSKPPVPSFDSFMHTNEHVKNVDEMFTEKVAHNQNALNYNSIQNGHGIVETERGWSQPEPKRNLDSDFVNKAFLRDFEVLTVNNGMFPNSEDKLFSQHGYIPNDPMEVPWQTNKKTQSVPLYRRQAGQSNMAQNDRMPTQGMVDLSEKQNSNAFSGYVRNFGPQSNDSPHMSQQIDRQMMNGNVNDYRLLSMSRLQQSGAEYNRSLNGTNLDHMDNIDNTTYASVLRQNTPKPDDEKGESISILRDYEHKHTHGLYQYFN